MLLGRYVSYVLLLATLIYKRMSYYIGLKKLKSALRSNFWFGSRLLGPECYESIPYTR